MKLTAEKVNEIFMDCLFKDGEDTSGHIAAEGVVTKVGFHPMRLEAHKEDIRQLLQDLPVNFRSDQGGGWSFLQACVDNQDNQWGEHRSIDQLLCLGIATKQAKILFPKEMWSAFPGSMPYFSVL